MYKLTQAGTQVLIQAVFSVELALSLNPLNLPEQGPVSRVLHLCCRAPDSVSRQSSKHLSYHVLTALPPQSWPVQSAAYVRNTSRPTIRSHYGLSLPHAQQCQKHDLCDQPFAFQSAV